jgi:hypothetical protein
VPRIDLWIAATMPDTPAVHRWRERTAFTLDDAGAVVTDVRDAELGDRVITRPDRVTALFGPPTYRRANRLVYDLALWPAHQFVWAISDWGDAAAVGVRLRDPAALPAVAATNVGGAIATFRLWHHTEHEVRLVWGRPDRVEGSPPRWWRWSYPVPHTAYRLRFAFTWGLLYEVVTESGPVAAHLGDLERRMFGHTAGVIVPPGRHLRRRV